MTVTLRIGHVARRLGRSEQAIRRAEWSGAIPPARRVFGRRVFSAEEVARLETYFANLRRGRPKIR